MERVIRMFFRILTMMWAVVGMLRTSIHANVYVYVCIYDGIRFVYIIFDGAYECEKYTNTTTTPTTTTTTTTKTTIINALWAG